MNILETTLEDVERALTYWDESSLWARLIRRDLEANDQEALEFHLKEAKNEQALQEEFSDKFMARLLSGDQYEPISLLSTDLPIVPQPEGFES